ncbi:hypothetical protein J6R97_06315 [bacterium]|nr:hypothetical protein [bacterium]
MKKILITLLLISPLSVFAIDNFSLNIPQWKDFAPSAFIDVNEPRGFGKLNTTAKYWYERKLAFEEGINICAEKGTHEEKFACYEELKINQFKLNTEYNAKIEAQQQNMQAIPEMRNRTDTMLPLNMFGGYAQMMPNELRGY